MVSVIIRAALLLYFLHLVAHVTGQSPCIPNFFRYIHNVTSDVMNGRIEIRQAPKGVALTINATLSIPVKLPTSYVGRIELAQSSEESVEAVQQGRTLKYNIYFPLPQPKTELTSLSVNDRIVCTGRRATGRIVTSIFLSHTLYPPVIEPLPEPLPDDQKVLTLPVRPPVPVSPITPRTPVPPIVEPVIPATTPESTVDPPVVHGCGRSIVVNQNIPDRIAGGEETARGQWPWLVAIYKFEKTADRKFYCGGTLVTNTRVITAAHCVPQHDRQSRSPAILVSVGRYRLHDKGETRAEDRIVVEYRIHPDYQTDESHVPNPDADLAVLILQTRVEFNKMIQPICLWLGSASLKYVVNKTGIVVGWGRDKLGNQYLEEPRLIRSSIVSQMVCMKNHYALVNRTSSRTFCAGKLDGSGPCEGDSGSGFVIYDNETDRYYLRGVVSISVWDQSIKSCDLRYYVIYVDAAKHLKWIQEQTYN